MWAPVSSIYQSIEIQTSWKVSLPRHQKDENLPQISKEKEVRFFMSFSPNNQFPSPLSPINDSALCFSRLTIVKLWHSIFISHNNLFRVMLEKFWSIFDSKWFNDSQATGQLLASLCIFYLFSIREIFSSWLRAHSSKNYLFFIFHTLLCNNTWHLKCQFRYSTVEWIAFNKISDSHGVEAYNTWIPRCPSAVPNQKGPNYLLESYEVVGIAHRAAAD